jgi:hypothetical protein
VYLFFRILFTMMISISLAGADASEHGASDSLKDSSVSVSEPAFLSFPPWAVHIPEHSFVGISSPCHSIEEARQRALESVIGQILQAMGAEYRLTHESVLFGSLHQSRHELRERLSYNAHWLLNSVQNSIRQYAFRNTADGHVCFVLVRIMPSELDRLKRLTMGAKLTARVVDKGGDRVSIEAQESNGVGVTITEYRVDVTKTHVNARLITLFFWKVPESDDKSYEGALPQRIFLKNDSGRTILRIPNDETGLRAFLMGSTRAVNITLTGYDEIGRPVSVPVRTQ